VVLNRDRGRESPRETQRATEEYPMESPGKPNGAQGTKEYRE
jgi:hypothetical protein